MKRIVSLLFALAALMTLWANPVSRHAARQTAALFAQKKGAQLVGEPRMAPGRTASAQRQPLYVFNMAGDSGFVIVAGDDKAIPVLGYATHGSYDEALLPDNFRYWLEQIAGEIEAIGENDEETDDQDSTHVQEPTGIREKIDPLIKTQWSQGHAQAGGYIYNMFCPEINGKRALTGCVATVGAQIMYYYQHPKDSIGQVPGYVREGAVVNTSAPLDSTIFKWDLMKLTYTSADQDSESAKAVAELMLYCGYAANMKYGLEGSGTNEQILAQNMATYFDYDPYTWKAVSRSRFSVSAWDETIYNELAEGRPVIYGGDSNLGGHAFLCDGYDGEGFYHFNWGWSGNMDGYFTLCATNPFDDIANYGYIFNQTAIIGLQPNTGVVPEKENLLDEPEELPVIEGTVATALPNYTSVQGTRLIVYFFNLTGEPQLFNFGLAELMADGNMEVLIKIANDNELNNGNGRGFSFYIPNLQLPEGSHTLVPVSQLSGEEEWRRCNPADAFYVVNVDEKGQISIVVHPYKKLVVNSFEVTSPCLPYQHQTARLSITNEGDFYDSALKFLLCKEGEAETTLFYNFDDSGYYSTGQDVKIKTGNTKNYDITFMEKDNRFFAPGSYELKVSDYYTGAVFASIPIVIGRQLEVTDLVVNSNKYKEYTQKVDVTVKNLAGDYTTPLYLFASRTEEMGENVYATGVAATSGDSVTVTFYFLPDLAGNWNLWVTYDEKGEEVVYHDVVAIVRDPEEVAKAIDVNNDEEVNLKDVTELSSLIGSDIGPDLLIKADINGDGQADVSDLVTILKALVHEEPTP